jgi:hypothetical protein
VPGLLVFSLRLLGEALLVGVRGILRALGIGGSDADRDEPAAPRPAATSDRMRAPRRRATPRRAEPAPEPPKAGGASVGAQVHVAEPWLGYDEMRLDEVLGRLQAATEVELAVVRAYEREHEARQAVLLAAGEPV